MFKSIYALCAFAHCYYYNYFVVVVFVVVFALLS